MLTKPNKLIEEFKHRLTQNGFVGEFHLDYPTRVVNATDNSIYELVPEAVAQPYHLSDLERLMALANQEPFVDLCFAPRGGGTGTNGQSLSDKIIIDFSRYMTRILDFNPEEKTVTVEPGVILTDLNRYLQPHGLFFAPHVSTADRATIGGMISTDAAGKGSLIYGKTADHIESMELILANGTKLNTKELSLTELDLLIQTDNSIGKIYKHVKGLLDEVQDEIAACFPPLKRPLSGYNIKQCYENGKFDLGRLISGSEGTLGIVGAATLKLLPIPKHKTLVVVHYNSFIEALKAAQFLIKYQPMAIEAIDEKVQKSAQTLPNWPMLAKLLNSVDKNYISNFIEFNENTPEELEKVIKRLTNDLDSQNANYVVITDNTQINQLWSIRSLAVGLAGKMPGDKKPVAFVEDAIVPPEHLADFVDDLQKMLGKENLNYAMYGHVDVGCIHVRPALDMQNINDRQKIRPITLEFIKLLEKYRGILWGEHGKGFRGEFVPDVFGTVLYPVLCKIKALFDPKNRLNPGKLASPDAEQIKLSRIEEVPMRGQFDQVISKPEQLKYNGAMMCNGNGACFNQEPSNVMCPSYKVTKDRIHSPKGRAMLVKEWLREKANKGKDMEAANMALDALNGCLGCKGCAGKCPTQVSIPDLRTSFLNNYHKEYKRRNIGQLLNGYIEHLLPIIAKFPKTWNFVAGNKLLPSFGVTDFPLFHSTKPLLKVLHEHKVELYKDPTQPLGNNPVIIYADAFTGLIEHNVLLGFIKVVRNLGYTPYVIYPRPSGKALIVGGFISQFKKNTAKLNELFSPIFAKSIPIIGLENTLTLLFRDEVNKFAKPFSGKVLTIAEFLSQNSESLPKLKLADGSKYRLLPHCTEQAMQPNEAVLWKTIYTKLGASLEVQNAGCCGMAGNYGYQKENQERSRDLFAMHWEKYLLEDQPEINILATGFSCRSQTEKQAGKIVSHPIEVLAGSII